jgi:hypothetical protein
MRLFSLKLRRRGNAGAEVLEYAGSLPTFHEMRPFFERELRRARRYERPMSVAVLSTESVVPAPAQAGAKLKTARDSGSHDSLGRFPAGRTDGSGDASTALPPGTTEELYLAQVRFLHVGALLRDALRETDLAGYVTATQEFIVLLPEIRLDEALRTNDRISSLVKKRLGMGLITGAAEYPGAGLTLGDLVNSARHGAHSQSVHVFRITAHG